MVMGTCGRVKREESKFENRPLIVFLEECCTSVCMCNWERLYIGGFFWMGVYMVGVRMEGCVLMWVLIQSQICDSCK